MRSGPLTPGEEALVQYLYATGLQSLTYEPAEPNARTHPDFRLEYRGAIVRLEVKDVSGPKVHPGSFSTFDPLRGVREHINAASKQFRPFKSEPCCLVLFSPARHPISLTDPLYMFGAMLGDPAFQIEHDLSTGLPTRSPAELVFFRRGKMLPFPSEQPQHRTVSAIAVLRKTPLSAALRAPLTHPIDLSRLGVIVYVNPFATHALPEGLFSHRYDRRYEYRDGQCTCVAEGLGLRFEERRA